MLALTDLPGWVHLALRIGLIVLAGLVAFVALRVALAVAVSHLVDRRRGDAGPSPMPADELERRVGTIRHLLVRIAGALIAVVAALMILDLFGIDIGPAVAGLGVVGIAVGLGAQAVVRDWLAGIFVVLENQYAAGDVVRLAGVEGTVEELSLRRTTVRDLDGTLHSVPNGLVSVASNLTRLWAQVNVDVPVPASLAVQEATDAIDRIGEELAADPVWAPKLLERPRVVRVNAGAEGALSLKVLGRVRAAEQWEVAGELRKRITSALAQRASDEAPKG